MFPLLRVCVQNARRARTQGRRGRRRRQGNCRDCQQQYAHGFLKIHKMALRLEDLQGTDSLMAAIEASPLAAVRTGFSLGRAF